MRILARAAACAAAFTFIAAPRIHAQSGTIRVTIGGGPRAGTYEMAEQCEMQTNAYPELHIMAFTTGVANPDQPRTMEFFLASAKGKPDGFVVALSFRANAGAQDRYEIFAIPPELSPSAPPLRGRGSVTVRRTATGTTATFRGQTKDGVRMEGTIQCGAS